MANVIINDVNLTNIANAIRGKNGSSDTYKPSEMADAITNLPSGGGGGVEVEPLVLSGSSKYTCAYKVASTYIKLFGDTITTRNLADIDFMFYYYENDSVPFELNMSDSTYRKASSLFYSAKIKEVPKINNFYMSSMDYMFAYCNYLKEIPEGWTNTWNWNRLQTYKTAGAIRVFENCYSLRYIDTNFLKNMGIGIQTSNNYHPYYATFSKCYVLNEIPILGVGKGAITSNVFSNTFKDCCRLKKLKFDMNEDGTPQTAKWKSQTIDLTTAGFGKDAWAFETYMDDSSFGIVDTATYEAYKDNPDSWTALVAYSRYNHDSAVETINSLPDCSASGTNIIKFKGEAGSATDGGAINTMTEEEIAVATAKGWTVTFA